MKEYHKIETLFERDMEGNKKLIEGKFRNESVEYLKDNRWIFTEKIDGTNVRVHWDGHKVSFGGRTDNAQMPTPLLTKLEELFKGNTNEEIFEQKFGVTEVTKGALKKELLTYGCDADDIDKAIEAVIQEPQHYTEFIVGKV